MKKVLQKFSQFYKNLPIAKDGYYYNIYSCVFFVYCHRIDHGHIF